MENLKILKLWPASEVVLGLFPIINNRFLMLKFINSIYCHYKFTNITYKATIASNGKAVTPVKISRATKEFAVVTNVSVTYKGKVYTTKTSFKP